MKKIPPHSPQPPQSEPPATQTGPSPQSWFRIWGRFIADVSKHLVSTGIRYIPGILPKRTAIDKRSIQHVTSNENSGKAFTLFKAHEYEQAGQFIKAAWLRSKASEGVYEPPTREWRHFRTLGKGGEGRADLVFEGLAGKLEVKKTSHCEKHTSDAEIALLNRLDHPNIVKISPHKQNAHIMENGGIPLLKLMFTGVSRHLFQSIAAQLADSLAYLKGEQIQHRDIKLENIVIDPTGHITLIDFGMAYDSKTRTACSPTGTGTRDYMAPDTLDYMRTGIKYSDTADMFAAGQTLFNLLTGYTLSFPIFKKADHQTEDEAWDIYNRDLSPLSTIDQRLAKALADEPPEYVGAVTDLLKRMLEPDPKLRITPEELQKHPFFAA